MPTNLYYKLTFIPARVNFAPFAKALLLQIFLGANQVLKCLQDIISQIIYILVMKISPRESDYPR